MSRLIFCTKLQQEAVGLDSPPLPGDLGLKIYEQISAKAWERWVAHQTMLINEYRLSLMDPKAREFLLTEMEAYLFGKGSAKPSGYTPENE